MNEILWFIALSISSFVIGWFARDFVAYTDEYTLRSQSAELREATRIIEDQKAISSNSDDFVVLSLTVGEWQRIRNIRKAIAVKELL